MDIHYLKKEINSIMKENESSSINSKINRDIIFYRNSLRESEMNFEFKMNVADIDSSLAQFSLGKSQFTRSDYELSWMVKDNEKFRFILTNIPYKNSKFLIDCPDDMKKDIVKLLPRFVELLVIKAKESLKNSSYQQ